MTELIIRIYSHLRKHRLLATASFLLVTSVLVLSVMRMSYKEDIADFLPLDGNSGKALKVYQNIAGADKIIAVFQYRDTTNAEPDTMVAAIESYISGLAQRDTAHLIAGVTAQVDMEKITGLTDFVYSNIPYFLTEADYTRMDSLLADSGYITKQLQADMQMLMFPSGGLLTDNISRDPLNLFTPVVEKLQHTGNGMRYEMYDGYIFSPDMQRAIVIIDSPFGGSETENNSRLVNLLEDEAGNMRTAHPAIDVHLTGGPVIAVGNAQRIKTDSILSVAIAVTLILLLLYLSFRSLRNLLLIAVSIAWGWLFAMGLLAVIHDSVSIIVVGISSVIVGIAVNYPLHFIAHLSHTPDKRKALREIVMPLVVGNVTTVGAFLALVPLQSVAMRDLGLFSSFLLIGTILFVLLFLPHVTNVKKHKEKHLFSRIGDVSLENKPVVVIIVAVLTLVFGYFSFDTRFDTNMSHINYMTDEQKADMAYFQHAMTEAGSLPKVYALSNASTVHEALDSSAMRQHLFSELLDSGLVVSHAGCKQFLSSESEQGIRLKRWNRFVAEHAAQLKSQLATAAVDAGFTTGSFDAFSEIIDGSYKPKPVGCFGILTKSAFASNVSAGDDGTCSVVDILTVKPESVKRVEQWLEEHGCYSFDVESMNSALADNLSDDFNYIGWACGCIVFFFLWLSLGSIELAILSFVPMAVSWLWILGIMALCGIQFNIVNVILATFIFGQGDDYTIFMTEGASYEYAYRRKMLASYKNSIIISALIMFIGIGTLIVARHPALRSLAEVTIAGMFSVVLMAYLFPPLIFNFLVRSSGVYRLRPVSLVPLLRMVYSATIFFVQLATVYVLGIFLFEITGKTERKTLLFRRYVRRLYSWDLNHIPGVKLSVNNPYGDRAFDSPAVVVCNHQSMLDAAVFMMLSDKTVLVANNNPSSSRIVGTVFKWMDFVNISQEDITDITRFERLVDKGYSIVMFPEGARSDYSSVTRFHKGAFYLAEKLGLDVLPVVIHGFNHVVPRNSVCVYKGCATIDVGERVTREMQKEWGGYAETTRRIHAYYVANYRRIADRVETAGYCAELVKDRYRYKGVDIFNTVKNNLKRNSNYAADVETARGLDEIKLVNSGYGEKALLMALALPQTRFVVVEKDAEVADVLRYSAEGIASNLKVVLQESEQTD